MATRGKEHPAVLAYKNGRCIPLVISPSQAFSHARCSPVTCARCYSLRTESSG